MARKPENTFISSVHAHLPTDLYRLKMHNQFNAGAADVWYSGKAADIWIEYKYLKAIPNSLLISVNVSELQAEWLRGRHREGRKVYVILGTKTGGILFRGLEFDHTYTHTELTARLQSRKQLADWITLTTTGQNADSQNAVKRRNRYKRLV